MGTLIVGLILLAVICLVVRKMIKDKKEGKTCSGCGCGCEGCHGSCHSMEKH
ncbi:MAG: FeoB-associated Cys-rich membrane protein [Ruminococcus sp.]|jgi:hypothetical protein